MRRIVLLSLIFFLLAVFAAVVAGAADVPALRWSVDATRPAPQEWVMLRGETRLLQPVLHEASTALAWPTNTAVVLYWQTNGMGSAWWTAPGSLGTSTGELSAVWSATNDVGAATYSYFVGASTADGLTYSAHGTLRMRNAPGTTPNVLALPRQSLDFATVAYTNAPWATSAEISDEATLRRSGDSAASNNVENVRTIATNALAVATAANTSATNAQATAATALQPSWATTGTVSRAQLATMLASGDGRVSVVVASNGVYVVQITNTTSCTVTETNATDGVYNGPELGAVFADPTGDFNGRTWVNSWGSLVGKLPGDSPDVPWLAFASDNRAWNGQTMGDLPAAMYEAAPNTYGTFALSWIPATNTYQLVDAPTVITISQNAVDTHNSDPFAHPPAPPLWQGVTNYASAITLTNVYERPTYLYATGTVSVAFSGLRAPAPLYCVVRGPRALTFAGAHIVGGGSWQTNAANHFIVWRYGTNTFVNPVTTSQD